MMQSRDLAARFEAYSDWRRRLSAGISGLHEWLSQQDLADAQADLKIQQLLERLHQDKLVVAFVAEFSRGKSELINAIFFADFGQRLLPSVGRAHDDVPDRAALRLDAPAVDPPAADRDARARRIGLRIQELRRRVGDAPARPVVGRQDEPRRSRRCRRPSACRSRWRASTGSTMTARRAGAGCRTATSAAVDIPCWRHAVINFPHPLLQQGLVILDTPGPERDRHRARADAQPAAQRARRAVHPRRRRRRDQDRHRRVERTTWSATIRPPRRAVWSS